MTFAFRAVLPLPSFSISMNSSLVISIQIHENISIHCKIWSFITLKNPKTHAWNLSCSYPQYRGHMPYGNQGVLMEKKMPATYCHPYVRLSLHDTRDVRADAWVDINFANGFLSYMPCVVGLLVRRYIACHVRCDVGAGAMGHGHFTMFLRGLLAHHHLLLLGCTYRRLLRAP